MSRFDRSPQAGAAVRPGHHGLDGHLLQLLVAVHEEGSITGAAQRRGVTQSLVSHLLDKLRGSVGDRLFVQSCRRIVATATADLLAPRARLLLAHRRLREQLLAVVAAAGLGAGATVACPVNQPPGA